MLRRLPINTIDSQPAVNQAQTSVVRIKSGKRGMRIYDLLPRLTAGAAITPRAAFGDIRLITDEKQRRVHTLDEIDQQLSFRAPKFSIADLGTAGASVYPKIQFAEWDRKQYVASERFALDLPANTEARLEIDTTAQAAAAAVACDIVYDDLDDVLAEGRRLGLPNDGLNLGVMEWVRNPWYMNGSDDTINNLVLNGLLYSLSLYNPAGTTISSVEINTDLDGQIFKRNKAAHDIDLSHLDLFPDATRFDIVPDASDNPRHAIEWSQYGKFDVRVVTAAAANAQLKVIVQRYVRR